MNNDRWTNAPGVLKAVTLRQLEASVSRGATSVLDGWAATNPKQLKAWEADGSLMRRAQEVNSQVEQAQSQAKAAGVTHLAPHEINEMFNGPSSRL